MATMTNSLNALIRSKRKWMKLGNRWISTCHWLKTNKRWRCRTNLDSTPCQDSFHSYRKTNSDTTIGTMNTANGTILLFKPGNWTRCWIAINQRDFRSVAKECWGKWDTLEGKENIALQIMTWLCLKTSTSRLEILWCTTPTMNWIITQRMITTTTLASGN